MYQQILAIPFAATHSAVDLSGISETWLGTVEPQMAGLYIDTYCMLIMGGIPWQVSILLFSLYLFNIYK